MKRYVLTKDKEIQLSNEYDDYDAYIDKSSDNLIDLAEVGDCWESPLGHLHQIREISVAKQEFEKRMKIAKTIYCKMGYALAIFEDGHNEVNNINVFNIPHTINSTNIHPVAIWKRNGDVMRRYSVE